MIRGKLAGRGAVWSSETGREGRIRAGMRSPARLVPLGELEVIPCKANPGARALGAGTPGNRGGNRGKTAPRWAQYLHRMPSSSQDAQGGTFGAVFVLRGGCDVCGALRGSWCASLVTERLTERAGMLRTAG